MLGECNKKKGGGARGGSHSWGEHGPGSKSQSGGILGFGGKGKQLLYKNVVS